MRASTAAPTYFPLEVILFQNKDKSEEAQFIFVDGGMTIYNNPAAQEKLARDRVPLQWTTA
jgi:patatin-like phospholipase/acyl hydrolase